MKKIIISIICIIFMSSLFQIIEINQLKHAIDSCKEKITELQLQQTELAKITESMETQAQSAAISNEAADLVYKRSVPLSPELQKFTYELCSDKNIDYDMVLAIMQKESRFQNIVSDNGQDFGLMQVNISNHEWLARQYGLTDMMNEYQNITAGITILSILQSEFDSTETVLMAYNIGIGNAQEKINAGISSNDYAVNVIEILQNVKCG